MMEQAYCAWIAAIKESCDDTRRITDLRNLLGDRYQLFFGLDNLAFEGLVLGCDELLAGVETEHMRGPRLPLVGDDRSTIE